jgi:hypothetical protein
MLTLALCELYNPHIHGGDNTTMKYKYLLSYRISLEEFMSGDYSLATYNFIRYYSHIYDEDMNDDIENYRFIIRRSKYYQAQIVDAIEEETGELSAVFKTHNLAILQRKWKKIYKERKKIIARRKSVKAILYKQIHGRWKDGYDF